MNIYLRIERLIFDGLDLPPEGQPVFQAALEAELANLLSTQGLRPGLAENGDIYSLPVSPIQLTADRDFDMLGRQVARVVYGGIGQGNLEQPFTRVVETG